MATKKIRIELPEYFTISHYKKMGSFEHLDDIEKVIQTIVAMTDYSEEDVMTWKLQDMMKVFNGVETILADIQNEFYPVFQFQGVTYGFQPLSKMAVGEYMDLERRLEDPIANLEEIMAILYRPVSKHNFEEFKWRAKSYIKHLQGKPDTLFKLYEVEEYDTEKRDWRAELFKELPIEYALGATSFFLVFNLMLQKDILTSSHDLTKEQKEVMVAMMDLAMVDLQSQGTTDISTFSETLTYLKSLQSPETNE
jgi:hypothetical protein